MRISDKLDSLAWKLYKGRDRSHGIKHVINVKNNALKLCDLLNINDKNTLLKIQCAALFHDLWDHKYISIYSIKYKETKDKLYKELKKIYFSDHDIRDIEIIIDNISLSREMNLRKENKPLNLKHLQLMRDIVSDADKLEMLGYKGFQRIMEYELHKNPNVHPDNLKFIIKKVYIDKISKLLDDNYIRTEPGKIMAKPLMKELEKYVSLID